MRNTEFSLWPTRCSINGLGLLNGPPFWVLAFLLRVHKLSIPPVLHYIFFSSLLSILALFAGFNFRRWNHWHFPNDYSLRNKILCMVHKQWGTWLMGRDWLLTGWTGWQAHYSQMRERRWHLLWPHEWDSGTEQPTSGFLRNQLSISAGATRTYSVCFPSSSLLHFTCHGGWLGKGSLTTEPQLAPTSSFAPSHSYLLLLSFFFHLFLLVGG